MHLELRAYDTHKPSKRDIGFMLAYVYVRKKWFFYQTQKREMRVLSYNYDNYPNVLRRRTEKNIKNKKHSYSAIQALIYKRKQKHRFKLKARSK